jgi:hypothetical protein
MVRTLRGHYVKTENNEGIGYIIFGTKAAATEWVRASGKDDCYVVKVRAALTPTFTGRVERMVAVHKAQPKVFPANAKPYF